MLRRAGGGDSGNGCCVSRGVPSTASSGPIDIVTPTTSPHTPLLASPLVFHHPHTHTLARIPAGIELDEKTSSMTVEQYLQHFLAKMTEKAQVRV